MNRHGVDGTRVSSLSSFLFFVCKYTINYSLPNNFTSFFEKQQRNQEDEYAKTTTSPQRGETLSNLSTLLPPKVLFDLGIQHGIITVIVLEDDAMFEKGDTRTDVKRVGQVVG